MSDSVYHKGLGNTWTADGGTVRQSQDSKYGAGIVSAEFPEGVQELVLSLTGRYATRDVEEAPAIYKRVVDNTSCKLKTA